MKFEPVEKKDRLNRTILFRSAAASDARDLIRYLKVTTAETPYLIREPEEVTLTSEQEEEFIRHCEASEKSLMLVATMDGKHIGNCSINPVGSYQRYAHRCFCGLDDEKALKRSARQDGKMVMNKEKIRKEQK